MKMNCANCGKEVDRKPSYTKFNKKTFCSADCQSNYLRTGVVLGCAYCGKDVYRTKSQYNKSKSGRIFCNRSCATSYNNSKYKSGVNNPNYTNGAGSYRNKIEVVVCEECGEDRKYTLIIHHKDGNRTNNNKDNLEVLCGNCHAGRHLYYNKELGEFIFNSSVLTKDNIGV